MPSKNAKLGERLIKVRQERQLSQTDLAKKAGLQPSAISHFETNRRAPSAINLQRLADALDVSADYLLGRSDENTASGPVVQRLLSSYSRLSAADQDNLVRFATMLAQKKEKV
jgi:transcriptional regulator with XRE-family HTH domain